MEKNKPADAGVMPQPNVSSADLNPVAAANELINATHATLKSRVPLVLELPLP